MILRYEIFKGLKGEGKVGLLFYSLRFCSSYSGIRVPQVRYKYQLFGGGKLMPY